MTKQDFIKELSVLEDKMNQYATTQKVQLTSNDMQLLVKLYPTFQALSGGQLPQVFNTGCSSCVGQVFSYYISFYGREAKSLEPEEIIEPVAFNEVTKASSGTTNNTGG
jgi:hypothetical protein